MLTKSQQLAHNWVIAIAWTIVAILTLSGALHHVIPLPWRALGAALVFALFGWHWYFSRRRPAP
jgi:hypothetical protein